MHLASCECRIVKFNAQTHSIRMPSIHVVEFASPSMSVRTPLESVRIAFVND